MTLKELELLNEKLGSAIYIRTSAPDCRPQWYGKKFFVYESNTKNCIRGCKTLSEVENIIRSRAGTLEKLLRLTALPGLPSINKEEMK